MKPSEIRECVLAEHRELRALFDEVFVLASKLCAVDDEALVDPLIAAVERLTRRVSAHTRMEDEVLVPVLKERDPCGPERADGIAKEHERQRAMLARVAERVSATPRMMVSEVLQLIADLRADMQAEEEGVLHPDFLRDDCISIDQTSG